MEEKGIILLLEDDAVDVLAMKRALMRVGILNKVIVFMNGKEALDFLRQKENTRLSLIFADINMPKMTGLEFLKEFKAEKKWNSTPVIMITPSMEENDRLESFCLGASGFITKAVKDDQFVETISIICRYWALNRVVQLRGA